MNKAVLQCLNLAKHYQQGQETLPVLDGLNFSIGERETVAIIGASGSGKSTLLNLLGGLDKASRGQVLLKEHDLATLPEPALAALRNRELGFVYQFHHLLAEFDARENVAMPLLIRGVPKAEAFRQAAGMLAKVGLAGRLDHRPAQLSGGERQRVAIARALVASPSCVLMDEPTGNLDEQTATRILELLLELNASLNLSFVVVTHDRQIAKRLQRILYLHDGNLQEIPHDQFV